MQLIEIEYFSLFNLGVCLARWESNYNTSAVGSLNWDGSWDHGLFQISDAYWCSRSGPADGACWVTCDGYYFQIIIILK